jgi:hypothetical protein
MSYDDFKQIKPLNKNWKYNSNGFVSCYHTVDSITKEVLLHDLVVLLNDKSNKKQCSIIHINKIGLDNRRENLIYDTLDKDCGKNLNKKQRTVNLPRTSGIDRDSIPTFIWYMKEDQSHGDRFMVKIHDISWKTTSARHLSLKYKLEEAKMYMRHLLKSNPYILEEQSMNGDYNKEGKLLLKSYFEIANDAGYTNIKSFMPNSNTVNLLKPDYKHLTNTEIEELVNLRNHLLNL